MYSVLRIVALVALALGFLFLTGCQNRNSIGYLTGSGIVLDSSVTQNQRSLIEQDLLNLKEVYISSTPKNELEIIGVENFYGEDLLNWLLERVKYVAGETFDYGNQAFIIDDHGYNPQIFEQSKLVMVMSNIGAGLYRYGKINSLLIGINIAGQEFEIKSPRSGIIQIGEGLFDSVLVSGPNPSSLANSFLRLHVFFHEGRHSDGNGNNAAFPHESCPSWHDYSGYYACDNNLNGPYTIGAITLKNFVMACVGCSNTEIQTMKAIQADSEYRILPGSTYKDPRPERIN